MLVKYIYIISVIIQYYGVINRGRVQLHKTHTYTNGQLVPTALSMITGITALHILRTHTQARYNYQWFMTALNQQPGASALGIRPFKDTATDMDQLRHRDSEWIFFTSSYWLKSEKSINHSKTGCVTPRHRASPYVTQQNAVKTFKHTETRFKQIWLHIHEILSFWPRLFKDD